MSRVPDPICTHARRGIVTTGDYVPGEPHAATNVCDRPSCIADAVMWARALTGKEAQHIRDDER